MEKKTFLKHEQQHVAETHERWLSKYSLNRSQMLESYKEEWVFEQCFNCQFYAKLTGLLETSWGVCSNKMSYLDGRLMFEHDGCEFYAFAEDEES